MSDVLFRVIDFETSDNVLPADVIEIGFTDLIFDTQSKECMISTPTSMLFSPRQVLRPDNIAIHHLTSAMLMHFPHCEEQDLRTLVDNDDPNFLVAANADFEKMWLTPEITSSRHWICTVKAAAMLFPDAPSHSNQAMRYELGLDLPEQLAMPPHRAGPDSFVTAHILAEFLKLETVSKLVACERRPRHIPRCPIGDHRGKPWAEVPIKFLKWILDKDGMDADMKYAARQELALRDAK